MEHERVVDENMEREKVVSVSFDYTKLLIAISTFYVSLLMSNDVLGS